METRCAGSLVGSGKWGVGRWIGVCSILATRAAPSPLLSSSVEPLFSLSLPTLVQLCCKSPLSNSWGKERGKVKCPLSISAAVFIAPASLSSSWFLCSHPVLSFPVFFPLPADVADPLSHLSLQAAGQVGRCQP